MKNKRIRDVALVVLSALIMSVNINTFVSKAGLYPGGFSGISFLFVRVLDKYFSVNIAFGIVYTILNFLPVFFVYRAIGRRFTKLSLLHVLIVSVVTMFIPHFNMTDEPILMAVFGGIINGVSITIAMEGNASSGGTDFVAIYFSKKYNKSTWNYILGLNSTIILIAGALFSWEVALYSIIFQFCTTTVINSISLRYQRATLFIVTDMPDEISEQLLVLTHHGATRFKGEGSYTKSEKYMLMSVVSTFEVTKVYQLCKSIDPHVFINVTRSEKIFGRFYQIPYE
ncbi:MAG: YitT family protein [Erysipelotrichaceae bacterium]